MWMENNYQGDLTDIIRASNGGAGGGSRSGRPEEPEFPTNFLANPDEDFGDPFTHFGDPFLRDIETQGSGFLQASTFFKPGFDEGGLTAEPPCEDSPAAQKPPMVQNDEFLITKKRMDSSDAPILSPRITGTRRRKNQAKKVVCIPAPLPANARSTGEVVPSDLWAWRKYGQKPIKGSPFPRAYYKCSSSKGCLARKQVERSRTDPSMLVITYTSEHNHQWPTPRNALAGSTRSPTSRKIHTPVDIDETPPSTTVAMASTSSSGVKKESSHQDAIHKSTLPESNRNDHDVLSDSLETLFARGFYVDGGVTNNPFSFFNWNWDDNNGEDPHPHGKLG